MTQQTSTRDMAISLELGAMSVSMNAQGVSWSPDVASDMAARCTAVIAEMLAMAAHYGLLISQTEVMLETAGYDEDEVDDGE